MSTQNLKQPVLASLLDRLIDETPERQTEVSSRSRAQQLAVLFQSVQRDLENLLNTRRRCISWPPEWQALDTSLVNYGIADFMGTELEKETARQNFCLQITDIIRRYDPRFKEIQVFLSHAGEEPRTRFLRLHIKGLLYAEPVPEPIILDSILEPETRTFTVLEITS